MIKKLTAVILLIGLFLSIIPVSAEFMFSEDYSERIEATAFEFVFKKANGSNASKPYSGGTVSASCTVKRTDVGEGSQSCTLVLMVYEKNKLIACKTGTVVAPETKEEVLLAVSEPATFPTQTPFKADDYKICAYIWTDFLQPKILTRPAEYKSSVNTLEKLLVNGKSVDLEEFEEIEDKKHELTYLFDKIPNQLPIITAKADDLGAKIQITDATAVPGEGKVVVTPPSNRTVDKRYYNLNFAVKTKTKTVANAISADTCSRTNYSTDTKPDGKYMYTNLYNGSPMNNGRNGTLKRGVIQIDVTKFPDDTSLIKDAKLVVVGQCAYNASHITQYCPSSFTVNAYSFSESEFLWAEAGTNAVDPASSSVGPGLETIIAKTPFDSFTVDKSDDTAGPWVEKEVNITELIKTAKENGEETVSVILLADNTDRATQFFVDLYAESTNNRDELMFKMGTKENTSDTYTKNDEPLDVQHKVILEYYEREE